MIIIYEISIGLGICMLVSGIISLFDYIETFSYYAFL